jgi:hypothetical protein
MSIDRFARRGSNDGVNKDGWEPMEAGSVVALKNGEIIRCE